MTIVEHLVYRANWAAKSGGAPTMDSGKIGCIMHAEADPSAIVGALQRPL